MYICLLLRVFTFYYFCLHFKSAYNCVIYIYIWFDNSVFVIYVIIIETRQCIKKESHILFIFVFLKILNIYAYYINSIGCNINL